MWIVKENQKLKFYLKWRDYTVVFAKQAAWPMSAPIESLSGPISSFGPRVFSKCHILNMACIFSDSNKQIQPPSSLWNRPSSLCARQGLWKPWQLSPQLCWVVLGGRSYTVVRVSALQCRGCRLNHWRAKKDVSSWPRPLCCTLETYLRKLTRGCVGAQLGTRPLAEVENSAKHLLPYTTLTYILSLYFYVWLAEVRDIPQTLLKTQVIKANVLFFLNH